MIHHIGPELVKPRAGLGQVRSFHSQASREISLSVIFEGRRVNPPFPHFLLGWSVQKRQLPTLLPLSDFSILAPSHHHNLT